MDAQKIYEELIEIKIHQAQLHASMEANTDAIKAIHEDLKPVRNGIAVARFLGTAAKFIASSSLVVWILSLLYGKN